MRTVSRSETREQPRPGIVRASLSVTSLFAVLIAANLLAWIWAWVAFADQPAMLGTALLAWMLGLRHAVDVDHIAAIDNAVRKLIRSGAPPGTVGLWFSLGHSSIVVLGCGVIALTTAAMRDQFTALRDVSGVLGSSISAAFLLAIAAVNMVILRDIWRNFSRVAQGGEMEDVGGPLEGGGILSRLCRPLFRAVTRSHHMYWIGFLFGLGFETTTEVALLAIAATHGAQDMPGWRVMVFPALFTAGMVLVDTADSVLMTGAYDWAQVRPLRKLWYNLTITAIAVLVALLVGGIEVLGLVAGRFALEGPVWTALAALNADMTHFGIVVIATFALAWAVSALVYRWKFHDRAP